MSSRDRRPLPRFALLLLAALIAVSGAATVATSAEPDQGTLSLETRQLTWTGEASGRTRNYFEPRPECEVGVTTDCDRYTLEADIDPAHWEDNAGGAEVVISWSNPKSDFDLYVYQGTRLIGESARGDTTSERVFIPSASTRGEEPYEVLVSPFNTAADPKYGGGVRLESRALVEAPTGGEVPSERLTAKPCKDGLAGPFPCDDVDLAAFLPVSELGGTQPSNSGEASIDDLVNDNLNDIWGWTDPQTKREYALVGKTDGTAFVDITDPENPEYRGQLVSRQDVGELEKVPAETIFKTWRDIKVYKDHAYIGSEEPTHGLQVFDLRKLREETPPDGRWQEDAGYDEFGNSHNIVINEESGFLYAVGTDTCEGGLHIVNIRKPQEPTEAGCVPDDEYTHDAQCVIYDGPDQRFAGREICFAANEDTVTVIDVTDKAKAKVLDRQPYDGATYTHQGWLTEDGSRWLVNDELDETDRGVATTTRIFNVERLDNIELDGAYEAKTSSIDHNLYVKNDTVYEANYRSGLRILDGREAGEGRLSELGFFDVYPEDDAAEFNGAWSNYPYFPSGTVVVSGIEQGLFVLRPTEAAGGTDGELDPPAQGGGSSGEADSSGPPAATPAPASGSASGSASAPAPAPAPAPQASCRRDGGFETVGTQAYRRRGLELEFERRVIAPVQIDVFQQSVGRRIVGERLIARFRAQSDDVRWNGKANQRGRKVRNGWYFVRYRMRTPDGVDTRRIAMQRRKGKWKVRPDFYRRSSCDLLRSFKLERPVFGGRTNRALNVAFQTEDDARTRVTVSRKGKVVKRFKARDVRARRTVRLRLGASKLRRGSYRVRIVVQRGAQTVTHTLTARKL